MASNLPGEARWRTFLTRMTQLVDRELPEAETLDAGSQILAELVSTDDWLPPAFAAPDPARYQQHLLHRDPDSRFSAVSFVWAPGQETPVHDHTVWGLVGMLRGREASQRYARDSDGRMLPVGARHVLRPGDVERLSPTEGDVHQVSNVEDAVSISIHVYGADIGQVRRHSFDANGNAKTFVSGYSSSTPPPAWTGNLG